MKHADLPTVRDKLDELESELAIANLDCELATLKRTATVESLWEALTLLVDAVDAAATDLQRQIHEHLKDHIPDDSSAGGPK